MKQMTNRLAAVLLALFTLTTVACDKNDGSEAPRLTLQDAAGSYVGTFDFTPTPSSLNPNPQPETGINVSFEVTPEGTVHFASFPADALVKGLLGEGASALLPMLGTISYDVTVGTPIADASVLTAALTAPVLRIDLQGMMVVLVTIKATEPFLYSKSGDLTFTLETTQCQLGEGDTAGEPFELINTLKFTAKKQ